MLIDEIMALDALNLRGTDGTPLDPALHRKALAASLPRSAIATVRRQAELAAYGYLWPVDGNDWFVGGISIHPAQRHPAVIAELAAALADLISDKAIATLRSHVRKGNDASLKLHRRLGFTVEAENDVAFAFVAKAADLATALAPLRRRF